MGLDEQYQRERFSRAVIECEAREKTPMFLAQDASLWGELLLRQGGERESRKFHGSFLVDMLNAISLGSLPEALERLGLDVLVRKSLAQREELNCTVF